jgi:hypothetical protein
LRVRKAFSRRCPSSGRSAASASTFAYPTDGAISTVIHPFGPANGWRPRGDRRRANPYPFDGPRRVDRSGAQPGKARRRRITADRSERGRFASFGSLLRNQEHDLRSFDRSNRSRSARQARPRLGTRGDPRHHQRDHRHQGNCDVDFRAGRAARRYLQRRARLRPARAAAHAGRHFRHHGERLRHHLHRSRRPDREDRHSFPRQPATDEYLPAYREPDWPAGG